MALRLCACEIGEREVGGGKFSGRNLIFWLRLPRFSGAAFKVGEAFCWRYTCQKV